MRNFTIMMLAGLVALTSCASANGATSLSGKEAEKEIKIDQSYNSLKVSDVVQVTYSEDATVLTLSADSAVLPYVRVKEKGGELSISMECSYNEFKNGNFGTVEAIVPASAALRKIDLSGVASIKGASVEAESFQLEASGASSLDLDFNISSEMKIDVDGVANLHSSIVANSVVLDASGAAKIKSSVAAESLELDASGAAEADIYGKVNKYVLEVSGAAGVSQGKELIETEALVCEVSGAGKAAVRCNGTADGEISGAALLKVYGGGNIGISTSGASTLSVIRK